MNRLLPVVASLAILSACGKDDPGLGATDGEADSGSSTGSETDPRFGAEQVYPLRLNEQTPAPLVLEMTRDEVAELFGDAAAEVRLLSLDPSPLLSGTIAALRTHVEGLGLALGAGIFEELVFRGLLVGGLLLVVGRGLGVGRTLTACIAIPASIR